MNIKAELNKILQTKQLRYISSKYLGKELYETTINSTDFLEEGHPLSERIYCIINDISSHPKCPYCNQLTHGSFGGIKTDTEKYLNKYCSISHGRKDQKKPKHKCENPYCYNLVSENINHYCSRECYQICSDIALEKRIKTNIHKYGTENVSQSNNVIKKIKQTKLDKYGDESYNNPEANKIQRYKTTFKNLERFNNIIIPLFNEDEFIGTGYNNIYK